MPTPKLKALYKRLGPTLFARAQRALKDDGTAQEVVQEVVIELSRLGDLSDAELLKLGRGILKRQIEKRGGKALDSMDSLTPKDD